MTYLSPPRKQRAGKAGLLALLALAFASSEGISAAPPATLEVPVSTVRSNSGVVFVALYDRPNWLKPGRFVAYRKVTAQRGTVVAHFADVRPGQYSVAVFHDENANGKVDRNMIGLPAEGFGFSRTTPRRVPNFNETSFALRRAATEPVRLRY